MTVEYRVVWKREGLKQKTRRYATLDGAERFMRLFGPEPWFAYDDKLPDALMCCTGYGCACGGITVRQHFMEHREKMPPLEYVRLEFRPVGAWRKKRTKGAKK